MFNPHPPLSSFPFVLLVLLLIVEIVALIGKRRELCDTVARFLLLVVCIALPLTYFSGYFGADFANRQFVVPDEAILKHQLWAKLSLLSGLLPVLIFFLSQHAAAERPALAAKLRWAYRLLIAVLCLFLARTSFLGGELVFTHGAGVSVGGQK